MISVVTSLVFLQLIKVQRVVLVFLSRDFFIRKKQAGCPGNVSGNVFGNDSGNDLFCFKVMWQLLLIPV